jgi:hypothetical protein
MHYQAKLITLKGDELKLSWSKTLYKLMADAERVAASSFVVADL